MIVQVMWGDVHVQFVFDGDGTESVLLDNGDQLNLYFCDLGDRDWYAASLTRADGTYVSAVSDGFSAQKTVYTLWARASGTSLWSTAPREPVDKTLSDVEFAEPVVVLEVVAADSCRHCTQAFAPGDMCPSRTSLLSALPCEAEPVVESRGTPPEVMEALHRLEVLNAHAAGQAEAMKAVEARLVKVRDASFQARMAGIFADDQASEALREVRELIAKLPTDGDTND